jgi:hypothetical protein
MSTLNQILAHRIRDKLETMAEIIVEPFDCGAQLGVAIKFDEARRHAVRVKIEDNDLTKAADEAATALNDWLSDNG